MCARFALMTNDLELLKAARDFASPDGHIVDILPPDAPTPVDGTYDGIMVDFPPSARHSFERKGFFNKLAAIAKEFPVVVFDRGTTYQDSAFMRAAGIRWFAVLSPRAFTAMLTHPLSKVAKRDAKDSEVTTVGSE